MKIKNILTKTLILSSCLFSVGCTNNDNNEVNNELNTYLPEPESSDITDNTDESQDEDLIADFTEVLDGEDIAIDTILKKQDDDFNITYKFGTNYSETEKYALTKVELKESKTKEEQLRIAEELKKTIENEFETFDKYNFKICVQGKNKLIESMTSKKQISGITFSNKKEHRDNYLLDINIDNPPTEK